MNLNFIKFRRSQRRLCPKEADKKAEISPSEVQKDKSSAKSDKNRRQKLKIISAAGVLGVVVVLGVWGVVHFKKGGRAKPDEDSPPVAHVEYSTTEKTAEPVTAKLVFDGDYTVLGDGKTEYTFTQNGIHLFKLKDASDNIYQIRASVTWIGGADGAPTAPSKK